MKKTYILCSQLLLATAFSFALSGKDIPMGLIDCDSTVYPAALKIATGDVYLHGDAERNILQNIDAAQTCYTAAIRETASKADQGVANFKLGEIFYYYGKNLTENATLAKETVREYLMEATRLGNIDAEILLNNILFGPAVKK